MADEIVGEVGSIEQLIAGDVITESALPGATVLQVSDVADFDEAGGFLWIDGEVLEYVAVDDDESTITLAAPTAVAFEAEEPVEVRVPTSDGGYVQVVDYDVELTDGDGAIQSATLRHELIVLLEAGTRGLVGEWVVAERGDNEDEFEVTRVLGKQAVLNEETVGLPQLQPEVSESIDSAQEAADQALAEAAAAQAAANAAATNAGAAAALAADAKTIAEAAETPAGSQAKADAAEAAAEAAAAADASAKASAAQSAAVAAAAADATTKANSAKSAAEAAAAVTAQAKADAAQAAAIAAASDDADDKAEAARLAAIAAAAIDAQNKADAAQAAAEAEAAAAQSTANAAQSAANAAQATANAAQSNAAVAQALLDSWKYSGTVKINGGEIQADTVLAGQIAADAITSKHTITGATVQTTATPARGLKMTSGGLVGHDAVGDPTFTYNSSNGNVTLKGALQSGGTITGAVFQTNTTPNSGLKIGNAGITGFDDSGNATLAYNAVTGALTLKGTIQSGSTISGATIQGGVFQTAASGERLVIDAADDNRSRISFHSGTPSGPATVRAPRIEADSTPAPDGTVGSPSSIWSHYLALGGPRSSSAVPSGSRPSDFRISEFSVGTGTVRSLISAEADTVRVLGLLQNSDGVVFSSYENTSGQSVASGTTFVTLTGWTDRDSASNRLSYANGVWTAPTAFESFATYSIDAIVSFSGSPTGRRVARILINGSEWIRDERTALAGVTTNLSLSTKVRMAPGSTVAVQALQTSGAGLALSTTSGANAVQIHRIY